tara:strand:+ start:170 stop:1027 length:858 start_codon:yes stop_codon:yes gene_type:complete
MSEEYTFEETSKFIDAPIGKLHYHEAGEGPALILIHGSGPGVTGWANFKGNLGLFSRHFRTLILDLPGYGGSPDIEGNPIVNAVQAVISFMDALGIERTNILGNSLGGIVGSSVAAAVPDRIIRLTTIGGMGVNIFTPSPAEGINLLVDFTEDPTRERIISWLRSMVYDQSMVTEELIEERFSRATDPEFLASSRKIYSREAMAARMKLAADGPKPWDHFTKIQCPTLITWGRDDRVSPVDMAMLPMRIIPKAELHVFYNCGHWAMIERKEEFESVVLAFFKRPE